MKRFVINKKLLPKIEIPEVEIPEITELDPNVTITNLFGKKGSIKNLGEIVSIYATNGNATAHTFEVPGGLQQYRSLAVIGSYNGYAFIQ